MRLESSQLQSWSLPEQSVLQDYFSAYWEMMLLSAPSEAARVVQKLTCVVRDARLILQGVYEPSSPTTAHAAAEFVVEWCEYKRSPQRNASGEIEQQVDDWLCEPETRQLLEAAFYRHADQPFAVLLAKAVDLIVLACSIDGSR
jgi:hypothetical protein